MAKITVGEIHLQKNRDQPFVVLTAYSAPMAKIIAPHVDMLLVGDSVGMALYGMENTLNVTLDMMTAHTQAVRRGAPNSFIITDMPYGTYEDDKDVALKNARVLVEHGGADAVKLEGGSKMAEIIVFLVKNDINVMAHIGLLPQAVEKEGGYKIKGKTKAGVQRLINDAKAVAQAGAFAFVLEGVREYAAREITKSVSIPSIGIGASAACDGQVLVTEDMVGLSGGCVPKFVKPYANCVSEIEDAVKAYADDVRQRKFPSEQFVYSG